MFLKHLSDARHTLSPLLRYVEQLPERILHISRTAWLEIAGFMGVLVVAGLLFSPSHFFASEPHPGWLLVLLMLVQYGMKEAIAATVLCSIYVFCGDLPQQNYYETTYAYNLRLVSTPVQWLMASLILGGIRSQQQQAYTRLQARYAEQQQAGETIHAAYQNLKKRKQQLELRLASEQSVAVASGHVINMLLSERAEDIFYALPATMQQWIGAERVSVYLYIDKKLQLIESEGHDDSTSLPLTYGTHTALTRHMRKGKSLSILDDSHAGRAIEREGVLACPIIDENGTCYGMMKVEYLPPERLNKKTENQLKMLGEWTGKALSGLESFRPRKPAAEHRDTTYVSKKTSRVTSHNVHDTPLQEHA